MSGADIRAARFHQSLRGYNIKDVDEFLKLVAREVDAGRSPVSLIEGAEFRQTLRGYNVNEVDKYLSSVSSGASLPPPDQWGQGIR
jgi:DivIVA domain-containing protein